jgi:hypothetical protein
MPIHQFPPPSILQQLEHRDRGLLKPGREGSKERCWRGDAQRRSICDGLWQVLGIVRRQPVGLGDHGRQKHRDVGLMPDHVPTRTHQSRCLWTGHQLGMSTAYFQRLRVPSRSSMSLESIYHPLPRQRRQSHCPNYRGVPSVARLRTLSGFDAPVLARTANRGSTC